MQIHIGRLIRDELRRQGHTNEWLAGQIHVTPRTVQRIFNKPSLDTQLLFNISKALHTNLFTHYTTKLPTTTDIVT
ncbi:MAG: helix-turn-helix transcriptional regulator [Bacteroidales bacterium]|nr:helix-turn-helix transcriptional regulator [Bacteroidales bacterium]